jgi:cation diffusion facilitator family transporter
MFLVNVVSALFKAASTAGTNSTSVFVDMLNDIGDAVGLGLILLGLKLSGKSKSITYPYGTRRALYVLGLMAISIFSGVILASAMYKVLEALLGDYAVYSTREAKLLFTVAFTTNALNLLTVYRSMRKNSSNPALEGTLLDAVSDFSGSALALAVVFTENSILDIIGGVAISIVILISALSIGYKYYQVLVGRSPPRSVMKSVLTRILSIPEVRDVNVFNASMITEDEYMLILEVEVDENLDVDDIEDLSAKIENTVKNTDPRFKHVIIEFVAERREPKNYKSIMSELETTHE